MRHACRVLLLTRLTGQDVRGPGGMVLGRLADLTVRLDGNDQAGLVSRLVITRRGAPSLLLPWDAVAHLRAGAPVLGTDLDHLHDFEVASVPDVLEADEILLRRDVLDTQVVDVVGQRLARVADVLLALHSQSGGTNDAGLEVLGVEVGFGAVLRRFGVPRAASSEDVISWSDLHLTSERGHTVQLATPRAAVHRVDVRALAAMMSRVHTDAAADILGAREPGVAAAVVRATNPDVGERVLRAMSPDEVARIVAAMPAEHASRWRDRLRRTPVLRGRRFLRSRVWPHRRHLTGGPHS